MNTPHTGRSRAAVLVDVIAGDHRRFDDGQRDAAAADELRLGQQRLGERVAQVVVDAVVQDHEVAHRIGRAQQRRQREAEERRVEVREQRRLGVVGREWLVVAPVDDGAGAQREADARQPHHRDVVGLDRDLVQEAATLLDRGRARRP